MLELFTKPTKKRISSFELIFQRAPKTSEKKNIGAVTDCRIGDHIVYLDECSRFAWGIVQRMTAAFFEIAPLLREDKTELEPAMKIYLDRVYQVKHPIFS